MPANLEGVSLQETISSVMEISVFHNMDYRSFSLSFIVALSSLQASIRDLVYQGIRYLFPCYALVLRRAWPPASCSFFDYLNIVKFV